MSISIGSDSQYYSATSKLNDTAKTDKIESILTNKSASDEDLMEACKSFESYLMEQVFKGMEKTVMKSEDEEKDPYTEQFGDKLYEEYAKESTEGQGLGLAQVLYDSMKRNT